MPQNRTYGRKAGQDVLKRATFGVAFAALVVCANAGIARADEDETFMHKFMHTLGLKDPRTMEYGISYSERSPLVVPPTLDLPPPLPAGPPPVANWPKDPDITKRTQAKKKDEGRSQNWQVENARPLRPDELNPSGTASSGGGAAASTGGDALPSSGGHGTPVSGTAQQAQASAAEPPAKKSMFSFDWFKKEEYATFTGEPSRASLTDPPPGYQTPSPDQPYGVGANKKASYQVPTLESRVEAPR